MRSFDSVEIAWTAITFLALLVHSVVLWDAWADVRLMKELGHKGRRWIVALSNLRRETIRSSVQLLLCGVGVIALLTPPKATENPRNVVVVVMFLLVSVLLLANSILDFRERAALRKYTGKEERDAR